MLSNSHAVIADTQLKTIKRPERPLTCLKTVLSFSQPSIADSQYNISLAGETKPDKTMTKCHICDRAMIGNPAESIHTPDCLPICRREKCRHERKTHRKRMNEVHREYRDILFKLEEKQ